MLSCLFPCGAPLGVNMYEVDRNIFGSETAQTPGPESCLDTGDVEPKATVLRRGASRFRMRGC